MSKKQRLEASVQDKFLGQGLKIYPKAKDIIRCFEETVLNANRNALEIFLKHFGPKIINKLGRAKTTTGAEQDGLYAGRYGDLVAIDVGIYWENGGTPSVWASVCVEDKVMADWLWKMIRKRRLEREEDEYYAHRFTSYETVSGSGVKGLNQSMRIAMDKWPKDIGR